MSRTATDPPTVVDRPHHAGRNPCFDPQPDPPGRNDELIPTGQLHGAEVSATRDRMGREDLGFSWGV